MTDGDGAVPDQSRSNGRPASDSSRSNGRPRSGPSRPIGRPAPIPALRGAFTFLTRLPIPGGRPADWDAFRRSPWTFPVVGAVLGAVAGLAFLLPVPAASAVVVYLCALYLLSGVTHADGLADLGDAVAAHDPERRREALQDSMTGVGGVLALGLTLIALAFGAFALGTTAAALGIAFRIALAAEVGAKVGMAVVVCLGRPAHEGLGSQLVDVVGPRSLLPAVLLAVPVVLAAPPGAFPALVAATIAGPAVALALLVSTRDWLGGVNGDVIGSANELGRATALHVGVVVWVLT